MCQLVLLTGEKNQVGVLDSRLLVTGPFGAAAVQERRLG